jgi:hypothetical protein
MKHKTIAILYFLFTVAICKAQSASNSRNNSLSLELGKTGLIYNLNFDHRFQDKDFGFRVGVGSNFAKYLQAFTTGAGGYFLVGQKINFLELGIDLSYLSVDEVSDDQKGVTLIYPNYSIKTFYASANIGYRRYGKSTIFRIGVSPGFIKNEFVPGGYLSFGLTF